MPHDIDLLHNGNFGPGKKPDLLKLYEDLLSPRSNQERISILAHFGFVDATDEAFCKTLLEFRLPQWEYFASKLLEVEIVPNQQLMVDINFSALRQHQFQQQDDYIGTKRCGPAEISRIEVRFDRILGESQKKTDGFRFERYIPEVMVRGLPLMPTLNGRLSTLCSAMSVQGDIKVPVVLKFRHEINANSDSATAHELSALKVVQSVLGTPKLHGEGIVESGSVLVMQKEANDSRCLETLDVRGFFKVIVSLLSIVDKVCAKGLNHLNLFPFNLLYNGVTGELVVGSLQYACRDSEAGEAIIQRCTKLGFKAQSPLKPKSINIDHMDSAPKTTKYDSFCAGAIVLCMLDRNMQQFSDRRSIDMSSLGNLSQQDLAARFEAAIDTFNNFIDPRSERIGPDQASAIIRLGCALLHKNPERRYRCGDALVMILAEASRMGPSRPLPVVQIVPAKFIKILGEMQRATKIKESLACVDSRGSSVPGRGLHSFGGACVGDLLGLYSGQLHTKQQGDFLTAEGEGSNLKSINVDGQPCVLDSRYTKNGFVDLNYLATHGAAGLANCNASIQVKRDGKGGNRIKVDRFPANAYFEKIVLSQPYKLKLPGNHFSNELIALRAARDLLDDEEIFADYGPGTMIKMFGLSSGELVITRRADSDKKRGAAQPTRQKKQQRVGA